MRRDHVALLTGLDGDSRACDARLGEVEHLLRLGGLLQVSMDPEVMQRTLQEHLRPLFGRREIRVTAGDSDPRRTAAWDSFPLKAGDAVVGALEVANAVGGRLQPLSGWQRRLLEMTSPLVGRAVRNAQFFRQAQQLSAVDVLTGCLASRHGMDLVGVELRRAQRYARPAALAFIDLDQFKQVNDRYGHLCGDAVLRVVGAEMKAALRGSDLCCRYGGDEFLLLLPETPLDGARHVAEMLRRRLAGIMVEWPDGTVTVTASIGVAAARPGELEAGSLLARADAAMYRAKRAGRNAVRVWEDEGQK